MNYEKLLYPSIDAAASVLMKIGVDPTSRDLNCQDFEYTTCKMSEFDQYFELYSKESTDRFEKRVLGCYLIETLNDYVSVHGKPHPLLEQTLAYLHSDYDIHQPEILYRLDCEDCSEVEMWPIAKHLLEWQQQNGFCV